jgi:CheY-like chemotaxis protein
MKPLPILLVEDDENDVIFVRHAFKQAEIVNPLVVVQSGEQAMDYLMHKGSFAEEPEGPLPCLILMDVNIAGNTSGLDILRFIRAEAPLRHLIVLLWSSTSPPQAVRTAYECGVNSFLVKPSNTRDLLELARLIRQYWLEHNQIPAEPANSLGFSLG